MVLGGMSHDEIKADRFERAAERGVPASLDKRQQALEKKRVEEVPEGSGAQRRYSVGFWLLTACLGS